MPFYRMQLCRLRPANRTRHSIRRPFGLRRLSAYHSEERKVQALYILVVGINPPKPPEKSCRAIYSIAISGAAQKAKTKDTVIALIQS